MFSSVIDRLIRQEMLDRGVKRPDAVNTLSRETGLSPGTFENLRRGRLKNVEWITHRIDQAVVRRLERQIAEMQSEPVVARRRAHRVSAAELEDALDALEKSKRLINGG